MGKLNKNHYLALFYIFFGLVFAWQTSEIKNLFAMASGDVGPRFFPYCCSVGFVLCGLGKFLTSKDKKVKAFMKDKGGWPRMAILVVILFAYSFGIKYIGFLLSSIALAAVMTYMLADGLKLKWWKVALFSVISSLVIYFFFVKAVSIPLPTGVWTKALLKML